MKITNLTIRCCKLDDIRIASEQLRESADQNGFEFLVYSLETETGHQASMLGFAGRSARGSGELAAASLKPLVMGRNALDREALWHDFRVADRWWHHLPIYLYGPLDVCLWLLGAQAANQPLYRYIGGYRQQIPVYLSSLVLPSAQAYADEAQATQQAGYAGYKTHPPGQSLRDDIALHHLVREAVGPEFELMSDPVACYTLEEAIRFGRALESLSYRWLEEPLPDEQFGALRELSRVLDIPIVGTEVLAKHPYSVAECVATRVVDIVRADVSWTGGVTGVLKTARLAESFHMNCEIHTAIFHPLELVNLHLACAVANCSFLELLTPVDMFGFGLTEPLPIQNGMATVPEKPGLGIELDWPLIDQATFHVL